MNDKKRKPILVIFMVLCMASQSLALEISDRPEIAKTLDSYVGKMTYDEAISMLGAPRDRIYGDMIFITTWRKTSFAFDKVHRLIFTYNVFSMRTEILSLTFDKENHVLQSWKLETEDLHV